MPRNLPLPLHRRLPISAMLHILLLHHHTIPIITIMSNLLRCISTMDIPIIITIITNHILHRVVVMDRTLSLRRHPNKLVSLVIRTFIAMHTNRVPP